MAKQYGFLKITGTLGDVTFVKTQDGFLAKQKSTLSPEKIATDPAFQRTRENMEEFARAARAGKLLREATRTIVQNAKDRRLPSRLTTAFMRVIQTDGTNMRGLRNVTDGDASLLQGFDFNDNSQFSTVFHAAASASIDRATGKLDVDLPAYVPLNSITPPPGASHYQVVTMGAEVDFQGNTHVTDTQSSAVIALDANATTPLLLSNTVTTASTHPLFLLLGIQFFQELNGDYYPLKNGAFNPLMITKVDVV